MGQARRRRDAEARAGRLVAGQRQAACEAVHRAIVETLGGTGSGHCVVYAAVLAAVATVRTGQPWRVVGGALYVELGPRRDGRAPVFAMTPDGAGLGSRQFHAWAACGSELADAALRHVRSYAEATAGCRWQRPDLPTHWWGPRAGLAGLGVSLVADRRTEVGGLVETHRGLLIRAGELALATL